MKRVFFFLIAASVVAAAAEFETGQGARLVIGQPSFTAERPVSGREFLGGVGGVAVAGGRLFVADSNRMSAAPLNHRVLIYENLSGFLPRPDAELPQGSTCPACVGRPDTVLGQASFEGVDRGLEQGLNLPTAVATDGVRLAVADTDNNRVLIWRSIPAVNGAPPDVVIGQPDLKTNLPRTDRSGLRGPQGVWFHQGRLLIADTQNSRVLIFNSIPTSHNANADIVLGQPDFTSRPNPDLTASNYRPTAANMLNPVAATASGNKLFVADLGFNRVLIYNSFPTSNAAAADVVLGQPNFESAFSNNSTKESGLCAATGKDDKDEDIFPVRCAATLSFPRYALSDGARLYIADGGNDRVLVYNTVPQANGAAADVVLGQKNALLLEESNDAGALRAPSSLAHDGANLYVADPFSRRILVFSPAERLIASGGVVNAASFGVYAQGVLIFDGAVKVDDEVKLTVEGRGYTYKAVEGDTLETVRDALLQQINEDPGDPLVYGRAAVGEGSYALGSVKFGGEAAAGDLVIVRIKDRRYDYRMLADDTATDLAYYYVGLIRDLGKDPNVLVEVDPSDTTKMLIVSNQVGPAGNDIAYEAVVSEGSAITATAEGEFLTGGAFRQNLLLVSQFPGAFGNDVDVSTTLSSGATIQITSSGPSLTGGDDASQAPAGTQVAIFGEKLAVAAVNADLSQPELPRELGGVQVYFNGVRAPLYSVTPNQVNAQVPFEVEGTSMNVYVRTRTEDGQIVVSIPKSILVTRASPGLYAYPGKEPRAGVVLHGMRFSRGTVALDAGGGGGETAVPAGILVRITVNGRDYEYTTVEGDTNDKVRDAMVTLINESGDPDVTASAERRGFLSARVRVTFGGEPKEGDAVTFTINRNTGRIYRYVLKKDDTLRAAANQIIRLINASPGDPDVTARLSLDVGVVAVEVIARELGSQGNSIEILVGVNEGSKMFLTSDAKDNKLGGGSTPAVVVLNARREGVEGDQIRYSSFVPGGSVISATTSSTNLCCGNDFMSPVTPENPAVPGEIIIVFGTGLGLTTPRNGEEGLETGRRTPEGVNFRVPFVDDDFVSSLAAGKTAQVQFVGLMEGQVGVYVVHLTLNPDLPDDPLARLTIAQGFFVSNVVTFPIRNRTPRRALF